MGYDIWQRGSSFCIRKENFPGLVKAAIQHFPNLFDEMSSVGEIFKEFDFEVDKDAEGNLSDIIFTGEKTRYEDELFETIAPFVEPGPSVSFYGEDGNIWQYCFDGKQCRDESPLLIWPGNPKPPKEGQSVYRLPFSIQGEIELHAASQKEACMALRVFDSEDFLSHLMTLFQKNVVRTYLRPNEMKKAEGEADALIL
ncbi:MAG: hypothetical protein HFG20_05780 [Anaerotruncus sp.]|nr:hypothetical protein [Anaerotruncus sp.]